MTGRSRAQFAEVVRSERVDVGLAASLVACEVEPTLDVDEVLAALDELAASAAGDRSPQGLRLALSPFAQEADFDDVRSSLLSEVLRRRRGLPLLVSIVAVEVATRLGLAASYATIPGRVVVVLGDLEDEHTVFDPYAGTLLDGPVAALSAGDLLLRLLTNIRALTHRQPPSLDAARTRLWSVELSLLLPRHPVALRRERGELLVRLGSHLLGAEELEEYAALVPDAAVAEECRREARQARARLN